VASWLVRSSPERAVRVRALARDIVLCSWARHFTLTVPLFTQEYKWVPANCRGTPNKLRGDNLRRTSIPSRGSRNTPSCFMLQKPGISSSSYGPVGSKAFFLTLIAVLARHFCQLSTQTIIVQPKNNACAGTSFCVRKKSTSCGFCRSFALGSLNPKNFFFDMCAQLVQLPIGCFVVFTQND